MKLEPGLLRSVHDVEAALQLAVLALAIAVALVTAIVAMAEARRAPSTAAGWLSGVALVAIIVLAVLVGTMTAGRASEICTASQYGVGDGYHGRRTASGRVFNTYAGASGRADDPYTIARPSRADLGRRFRITNLKNGASIEALSTDLGPFIAGRCVDLGRAGADALGMGGLAFVRVERLD